MPFNALRRLQFQLSEDDRNVDVYEHVIDFADRHKVDQYCVFVDGTVILIKNKGHFYLQFGLKNILQELNLTGLPHLANVRHIPNCFISTMFQDGYDKCKIILSHGQYFKEEYISSIITETDIT